MVKKNLYAYLDAKSEVKQLREEMARINEETTSPGSPDMSGMPKGGGYGDQMVSKVSARIKVREKYERQLHRMEAAMLAVEEMIERLPTRERLVLRYRYIMGMTWENVCVAMSYSWRQTHRVHSKALDMLVEMESPER